MVKWTRVCSSKRIGGLGIKDLHKQNISLLIKWWWKLEIKDGLWQQIILARYFKNKTVANIRSRFSDSPCWKAIMKVKETYMAGRAGKVNSGNLARVWHEPWIDVVPTSWADEDRRRGGVYNNVLGVSAPLLHLNPSLIINCFVQQYIKD